MAPMNGTIKRLVSDKGFGFILASDGNEYFFHNSACSGVRFDDLREGQAVTFERGQGPKGPRGENVKLQKQRFDAGLVGDYELRLSEAERSAVAAQIPALERAVAQTEAALAVLAGRSARAVYTPTIARGTELEALQLGPDVPAGLPADLLARRPWR